MKFIYLDNAASTPVDPRVLEAMIAYMRTEGSYGHPGATHYAGHMAAQAIAQAADQVGSLLNCASEDIVWTSGSTQSIELALQGSFEANPAKPHIITMSTEHPAVLTLCTLLEGRGAQITRLNPGPEGLLSLADLKAAIRPQTALISIMHVNNETGIIQDIAAIADIARTHGVLLHVDAAQSLGKLPIDMRALPIDLLTGCAHKMYGPKGVGIICAKPVLQQQLKGHGGTLPTHQIVAMGAAAAIARAQMSEDYIRVSGLRDKLWAGLCDLPRVYRLGEGLPTSPYILNMRFEGISASLWMEALPQIAFSAGSACNSSSLSSSYVLKSLGLTEAQAKCSLRFSLGRFTEAAEIEDTIAAMRLAHERLSAAAGWWGH